MLCKCYRCPRVSHSPVPSEVFVIKLVQVHSFYVSGKIQPYRIVVVSSTWEHRIKCLLRGVKEKSSRWQIGCRCSCCRHRTGKAPSCFQYRMCVLSKRFWAKESTSDFDERCFGLVGSVDGGSRIVAFRYRR